jgi:SpoVK/Ycf46/Vps4 family AAA+-type ATPase
MLVKKFVVDKVIFVFEEIDCGKWKSILKSRDLKENEGSIWEQRFEILREKLAAKTTGDAKEDDTKGMSEYCYSPKIELTLSDLLTTLDGIIEHHGRVIIFTSNHPDKLDSALIRPGRIDLCIEMKKMRRVDVADMYRLWFEKTLPDEVLSAMLDYQYTQADMGQLFSSYDKLQILDVLATNSTEFMNRVTGTNN